MHLYWIDAYRRQGLRNALDSMQDYCNAAGEDQEDVFLQRNKLKVIGRGLRLHGVDRRRQGGERL